MTIEDVIEEIVGDIADEHDRPARGAAAPDGCWTLSGLLRPDEVEDLTGIELPDHEDYDTIAGLVLQVLGRVPDAATSAEVAGAGPVDPDQPERQRLAVLTGRAHGRAAHRPRSRSGRTTAARRGRRHEHAAAVLLAILLLLGNAFFVAAEFALVSARRTQIEPRAEAGSRCARTTLRAMENMSLVIGRRPARHHGLLAGARCRRRAGRRAPARAGRSTPLDVPESLRAPGRVRGRAGRRRSTCTWCSAR